eukprot:COSAG06_NODE_3554_length_5196_cov_4.040024_4_plen_89_part_00
MQFYIFVKTGSGQTDFRRDRLRTGGLEYLRGIEDVRPVVLERVPVEDAREQLVQLLRRPQQRRRLKAVAVGPDVAGASVEPAEKASLA